jgi:hypothetical protein
VTLGRSLLVVGVVLTLVGVLLSFGGTSWRVYVPLGTSVLLSVALTLVFALVGALSRR